MCATLTNYMARAVPCGCPLLRLYTMDTTDHEEIKDKLAMVVLDRTKLQSIAVT